MGERCANRQRGNDSRTDVERQPHPVRPFSDRPRHGAKIANTPELSDAEQREVTRVAEVPSQTSMDGALRSTELTPPNAQFSATNNVGIQ